MRLSGGIRTLVMPLSPGTATDTLVSERGQGAFDKHSLDAYELTPGL